MLLRVQFCYSKERHDIFGTRIEQWNYACSDSFTICYTHNICYLCTYGIWNCCIYLYVGIMKYVVISKRGFLGDSNLVRCSIFVSYYSLWGIINFALAPEDSRTDWHWQLVKLTVYQKEIALLHIGQQKAYIDAVLCNHVLFWDTTQLFRLNDCGYQFD